jgi:uncharacterized metal-binding protein YceD (DUF177 family)
MMSQDLPLPEFSRPIAIDSLGMIEKTFTIAATPEECQALTGRFGILGVDSLSAVIKMKLKSGGEMVQLRGEFTADVRQTCVITLEPVPQHLEEAFEMLYGPEPDEDGEEIVIDMDVQDPPEPIVGGCIDIGEAAAEHLALALDPFPRASGAVFESSEEPVPEPPKPSPFAALASLKKK